MSEKSFQGAVVEYAVLMGWLVYHTHDSRRSVKGFPDLVLIRHDRVAVAELKTEQGRLAPEQRAWLDAFSAAGVEVHVWRPADWPEIFDALKRRTWRPRPAQLIIDELCDAADRVLAAEIAPMNALAAQAAHRLRDVVARAKDAA